MKNSYLWVGLAAIILLGGVYFYNTNGTPAENTPSDTASTTDTQGEKTSGTTGGSGTTYNDHSAPIVKTVGFASVSSTTAAVVGTVIPGDANTTYWFEYGTTLNFGSRVDAKSSPATNAEIGTSGNITGLKANTQYYFRAGAKNAYGTVYSGVYAFITAPK